MKDKALYEHLVGSLAGYIKENFHPNTKILIGVEKVEIITVENWRPIVEQKEIDKILDGEIEKFMNS